MNQIKVAIVLIVTIFVLLVVVGVTPTSAGSPSGAPPTVVLPTPVATKPAQRPSGPAAAPTRAAPVPASTAPTQAVRLTSSGGPPGGGFYSGQTIMNTGTANTTVSVTLYDSVSSNTYSISHSVNPGASWTFFPGDVPSVPSSFQGSAIASADQPLAAIVNVTNRPNGSYGIIGGTAAAQYHSIDASKVGTTLSFPLAKSRFGPKTTAFYIQNAGSGSATFAASFLMGTSLTDPSPVTYSYTSPSIGVGQMAVVIPADASVPAGRIGSLTVTSAQAMAGIVLEYDTSTSPALILQATNGFTPADYNTTIYFPVVKKKLGSRSTGLQIQNVTGSSNTVNVTYYGAGGSCPSPNTYTESARVLSAFQSTTYLDSSVLPSGCLASAVATGSGNIAAVVNEAFLPCSAGCTQRATTYSAFPAQTATSKLVAPVYKQRFGNKWTGLSVQNVGSSTATATVVFQVGGTTYTYNNLSIAPNSSKTLLDMSVTSTWPVANWTGGSVLPNGSLAAVTITANQPIIGLANEAPLPGSGLVQDNTNYEAFNVAP